MVYRRLKRHYPILIPLLVLSLPIVLAPPAAATWVSFSPTQDTVLHEGAPSGNYGDNDHMEVRNDSNGSTDRDILLKFNVSSIPASACVTQATLKVYQYDTQYMSDVDWLKIGAYRLLKDWGELTATWNSTGYQLWGNGGARDRSYSLDRHAANNMGVADSVATCTWCASGDPGRWVEWDVTPSVQMWHRNANKNFGLVLDKWLEGTYSYDTDEMVEFLTKEYVDPYYRPRLEVTYFTPTSYTPIDMKFADLNLNYFNYDAGITFSQNSGKLLCSGTTTNTDWGWDGSLRTIQTNSSFQCSIKVKLEQGMVNVAHGQFSFAMCEGSKYIRLQSVGYGSNYYEISGYNCEASGNGEHHLADATYWASYWDDGYPTGPPSGGSLFFSQTPENEQSQYLTWTIGYDKTQQTFAAYMGSTLVTYYTKVDFNNFQLSIAHLNDFSGVATTVWTIFQDTTPPSPNPMTWATQPYPVSQTQIDMVATTATDDTPPVQYYFHETTGHSGGTTSTWIANTNYSDTGLSANTQYGYEVKARDSAEVPNETSYSSTVLKYTLMPAPTGCTTSNVQATTVDLAATGSFPNIGLGSSGTRFATTGGEWAGSWKVHQTTDQATGLTPNTLYTFKVQSCNGDAVETAWGLIMSVVRTLAALPTALGYNPVTSQAIQANWESNGNPPGTEYYCMESTTGQNSGWITDMLWCLIHLRPNTDYHFYVKARNANHVETGYVDLGVIRTNMSIGQIKQRFVPGQHVIAVNKVVTAVFKDYKLFFIEDQIAFRSPEGVSGIGVKLPDLMVPPREGEILTVFGTLALNDPPYDKELVITDAMISQVSMLQGPFVPYGSNNRSLGGGVFGSQPGVWDNVLASPPVPSYGLSMVGMLVRGWGKLIQGPPLPDYVWLDDGSPLNDGRCPGVCIDLRPVHGYLPDPLPAHMAVTGILRCEVIGGYNVRVIWPRRPADLEGYD